MFLEVTVDLARESMKIFMSLVVLRLILRNKVLTTVAAICIFAFVYDQAPGLELPGIGGVVMLSLRAAFVTITVLVLIHLGLLAVLVGFVTYGTLMTFPLHIDVSSFYAGSTWLALGLVAIGTAYGAITATGRKR